MKKSLVGSVFLSAPQGSGKTKSAPELAKMFGCVRVVDDWDGKSPVKDGSLVLTSIPLKVLRSGVYGEQPAARVA